MTGVVAYVPDLMDRSRIQAAVPAVEFVGTAAELATAAGRARLVIVDIARPGVVDVLGEVRGVAIVAFAPHVDRAIFEAAEAAGVTEVLPRSQFFRRLPDLLSRL